MSFHLVGCPFRSSLVKGSGTSHLDGVEVDLGVGDGFLAWGATQTRSGLSDMAASVIRRLNIEAAFNSKKKGKVSLWTCLCLLHLCEVR